MRTPSARVSLLAAALALGAACGSSRSRLPVQLVTRACSGTQPLEGATHLRLRVTGEGMEARELLVPVDEAPEALELPPGPGRVLEVRAYERRPEQGGRVLALGRSLPFDLAEGSAPPVRVVLRRTNAFTPVSGSAQPELCGALAAPRAGHSATLLADGRVLLAGGFTLEEGVSVSLSSAELYTPATGTVEPGPELAVQGVASPRAFHSATLLPSGRVLLAGGEETRGPRADALLLEPAQGTFQGLPLQRPRSRHAAAADAAGHVLLAGGVGEADAVVAEAEGLLPEEGRSVPVALPLAREGAVALTLPDGQRIAVVGGADAAEVPLLRFEAGGFVAAGAPLRLLQPRSHAAVAPFAAGERALVLGGFAASSAPGEPGLALATSELLPLEAGASAAPGANVGARGDPCAVRLPDGRVLAVGGRTTAPGEPAQSSGATELIVPPAGTLGTQLPVVLGMPRLAAGRWAHTCTLLPDGTVLVAGGLRDERTAEGPVLQVLPELLLFTPAPLD